LPLANIPINKTTKINKPNARSLLGIKDKSQPKTEKKVKKISICKIADIFKV
tara:strand:- start:266 stop:421 length:156 start_codon:yes stop_codon:yes gene_type:complete